MALSSIEITAIVLVVVLAVAAAGLLLFVMQRLRRRRAQLLHELHDRPELSQDRAFNRLVMARREADILERQGADVTRARQRIAEAQGAFDTRAYDRAYQSAQLAHESLVNTRIGRAPLPSSPGLAGPTASIGPGTPPDSAVPESPGPAIAKNRAEAKFQLQLLEQDVTQAGADHPDAPGTAEAAALHRRAQAAFDLAEFTDAFALALKGRRALGRRVEALPPSPATRIETRPPGSPSPPPRSSDVDRTAERVAGAERCPQCGYPALTEDTFCRGCGTPRGPVVCSSCGAARAATDTFCGRCGAAFA